MAEALMGRVGNTRYLCGRYHRIPSLAPRYCYGKRINYVDKVFMHEDWSDLYDANMKLWKVLQLGAAPKVINGVETSVIGSFWAGMWDF